MLNITYFQQILKAKWPDETECFPAIVKHHVA